MSWQPMELTSPAELPSAGAAVTLLTVSPFSAGIREGDGLYTWLSFPAAVEAIISKLPDDLEALLLIAVADASYQRLAAQCESLAGVLPIKEIKQLQRQAKQLVTLETDKFKLVPDVKTAKSFNTQALPTLQSQIKKRASQIAKSDASGLAGADPLASLDAFAAAKSAFDSGIDAPMDPVAGGAGWGFYAEDDFVARLRQGHPQHNFTMTAIVGFAGSVSALAPLRAMLA